MPLRERLPALTLTTLATLALAFPSAASPWRGSVTQEDGVEVVHNPAEPSGGEKALAPTELWHLGADEDAPESELFGMITNILVDEDGNSYLLDMQLNEIRVFSPTGEYLRSLGRNGEGPGEFRNGMHEFFLPEGRIGVAQMMPSRIAVLGREGDGFADLTIPGPAGAGLQMVNGARGAGDHCVLALMTPIQGDGRSETRRSLIAVAPDGALKATYNELSEFFEGGGMRFSFGTGEGEDFTGQWDVDGAGRVYTAPMYDQYLLRVYAPDGKLIRRVLTDYEHLKRTKDEIAEIEERQAGLPEGFPRPEINPYLRDVRGIVVRPDGSVWVDSSRNSRRREAGAVGPFDRYDPQGRFVERVTLKADYDPERDDVVVAGDRLFVIKEAQMTSGTFQASSGAMNMVITMGGGDEEDEDEELDPAPLSVISYRLPAGY
ncbi:MAG: 6-bladed beta-propeller [Candidatus Krumholzibacteriia bacterium]